jgi:deazaflavin-dependent oxidoreductase (nitroreductase family)
VSGNRLRQGWLWLLKNTLNRATTRLAYTGHGPFSVIRHTGRKTGKRYETPIMLARLGADFVAELTYGPQVSWYRNVVAAGHCTVVFQGTEHPIDRIEPCDPETGRRAFGQPAGLVLRLLHRREFRLLRTAAP